MGSYFGYIRVSTARQGERGVSLQEQRDAISRYAETNGLAIAEWYEERITAAKSGRPVFGRMLSALKDGKANGVIIHKIDRSARNLRDWAYLGELLDTGLDVRFVHEAIDLNSRGGRLSADIQAVVAADYVRNLRDETLKGIRGRLKQGLLPMGAPLGYRDNGGGKPKTICPIMGPLVKQAFEMYATGQYSLYRLAETMYKLGVRSRSGAKVSRSAWVLVLRNPFYIGTIRLKTHDQSYIGVHKPQISKSTFDRVQLILDGRRPKQHRIHDYAFRQVFRCQGCGNFLIGERQKGHIYYRCHTRACRLCSVREEVIDAAVKEALAPLRFRPEEIGALESSIATFKEDFGKEQEVAIEAVRLQLNAVNSRLSRLADAYIDEMVKKSDFEERRIHLIEEQRELEDRLTRLTTGEDSIDAAARQFLELAKSLNSCYEIGISADNRDVVRNVFSNRLVAGKNVGLSMRKPFQMMANRPTALLGCPLRSTTRTFFDWVAKLISLLEAEKNS